MGAERGEEGAQPCQLAIGAVEPLGQPGDLRVPLAQPELCPGTKDLTQLPLGPQPLALERERGGIAARQGVLDVTLASTPPLAPFSALIERRA